jgi:hypothetical protein
VMSFLKRFQLFQPMGGAMARSSNLAAMVPMVRTEEVTKSVVVFISCRVLCFVVLCFGLGGEVYLRNILYLKI